MSSISASSFLSSSTWLSCAYRWTMSVTICSSSLLAYTCIGPRSPPKTPAPTRSWHTLIHCCLRSSFIWIQSRACIHVHLGRIFFLVLPVQWGIHKHFVFNSCIFNFFAQILNYHPPWIELSISKWLKCVFAILCMLCIARRNALTNPLTYYSCP